MALSVRRSRAVLAVLVVAALAAALLVVGAAKSSQALNGKVLILDSAFADGATINEQTQAATLGLGADVVTPEQWAAMTATDFAQYDAIVFADDLCAGDSATTLAAALDNLPTWVPTVTGNVFVTTADDVDHANFGNNETGATLQVTKGIAFAAGGGTTGMYLSSSCYDEEGQAWLTLLDAISPGWSSNAQSADTIHVTGSAALLAGLDDDALSFYGSSVHNLIQSWPSDFTVYAIATDAGEGDSAANQPGAGASVALEGPYTAQDGTTGAPVVLIRGANTSPSHILLQDDQTHLVGETAHLLATVTNPNLDIGKVGAAAFPVDGITVTFTAVSGPNAGKVVQGVTDTDGNVTVDSSSAVAGSDVWEASFVDPDEHTETSNQVTVTWTAPEALVVAPRFTG